MSRTVITPSPATLQIPVLGDCTSSSSPCDGNVLQILDGGLGATLLLNEEGPGQPDVPFLLEVLPGLSDLDGVRIGRSRRFPFQFAPDDTLRRPDDENDVCGAVVLGQCDPPDGFPPDAFCQEGD